MLRLARVMASALARSMAFMAGRMMPAAAGFQ
jgi:hypothetical protein